MVYLYYWNARHNAGDYYAKWLANKLYADVEFSAHPNLIITGSLLACDNLSNDTIVWGAGWHNTASDVRCYITNKNNFRAVRGKLTAAKFNLTNCALGDPGLLLSKFYTPKEPNVKKKYCIVCHWRDYSAVKAIYGRQVDVISMEAPSIEELADTLNKYELVLSTSLHGIIFAHSYGISAVHVEYTKLESKDNFKFKDYFSVLDIPYEKHMLSKTYNKNDLDTLYRNRDRFKPSKECVNKIIADLLAAAPAEAELDKKYKSVVCAIAKNEHAYINNWVNYNLNLGFEHIYLFNNDDNNKDWVGSYIDKIDNVTIINVNNIHKHGFQLTCYNKFYSRKSKLFDWVAFIDIDEFITGCANINEVLYSEAVNNFDMIRIKWRLFGDDDVVSRDIKIPVQQFFKKPILNSWLSNQGKCIIRGGLSNVSICSCHYAVNGKFEEGKTVEITNGLPLLKECLPSGKICTDYISMSPTNYADETVFINHYMTKTIAEFINQKYGRGDAVFEKRNIDLNYFWAINKKTKEKINFINNLGLGQTKKSWKPNNYLYF